METDSKRFKPVEQSVAPQNTKLEVLGAANISEMSALLKQSAHADGRDPRDIVLTDISVNDGIYVGAYKGTKLVGIAGTHMISKAHSVAAVGNVVVHPGHRKQRLASLVSSEVVKSLMSQGISQVVLNASSSNTAALKLYSRLGFDPADKLVECFATRKWG